MKENSFQVCIIDDREDVWNFAPNLIHVRPYHFFRHTGDINAPPGLTKQDEDDKTGISFNKDGTTTSTISQESSNQNELEEAPSKTADSDTSEEMIISTQDTTDSKSTEEGENNLQVKNDLSLSDEEESAASDKSEDANEGDKEESCDEDKNGNGDPAAIAPQDKIETPASDSVQPELPESSENNENADPSVPDITDTTTPEEIKKEDVVDSNKPNDVLEVEDQDDYLMYLEHILESIHKAFYSLHSEMLSKGDPKVPDVKTVIPYVRKKVLKVRFDFYTALELNLLTYFNIDGHNCFISFVECEYRVQRCRTDKHSSI